MIEQLQMPGCEIILAVTASWLNCACGFCYALSEAGSFMYVVFFNG